jgi:hypothetical protein
MSIDGIGRPPIPKGEIGSVGGSGRSSATGEGFRLEPPGTTGTSAAGAPSQLLSQLERGEISVDAYVQARVDEAVRPFEGRISDEQLKLVRDALSAEVGNDPVVVELVQRATAGAPKGETAG